MDLLYQVMRLEDAPELMQHIQLLLPEKRAARTSVLSKSWLHAWSTIPTLRFHVPLEQERKHLKMAYIDRTMIRYIRDNIPIERFDLNIQITNRESASLVEKWIRSVLTKTCLKELSLVIHFWETSLNLPDELLSGENITKLIVSATVGTFHAVRMPSSHNHNQPPVINCLSLRELHLIGVCISQQLLDHILSSCRLLAKIKLKPNTMDLKTIKVKSLPCLEELEIATICGDFTSVEINHVPNLRLFCCNLHLESEYMRFAQLPLNAHSISLGSRLTQLLLGGPGLVTDDTSLNMIKSGFPFLKSLTLIMICWRLTSFHFTCVSPIKSISLITCPHHLIDIQVNAPNLLFFYLNTSTMPTLSFPISTTLEEIKFRISVLPTGPLGVSWFLRMRETLELSRKCYLDISKVVRPVDVDSNLLEPLDMDFDLDDLKTRLQFPPAKNMQALSFETCHDECLWDNSPFFDALFEIFHPKLVFASPDAFFKRNNHFCRLMLREVLQKKTTTTTDTTTRWPHYLKRVKIRTKRHKKWKTLSNYHTSVLDGSTPTNAVTFKLKWC